MRGEADFNASRLVSELGVFQLTPGASAPAELAAYRAFYGFHSDVDHYIGRTDNGRHWICVQAFVPPEPKATVFVCHGYYDHTGLYVYLIEHLLSRGLAVLSVDLPGHGLSSGERATIDDFDDYVRAVEHVLALETVQAGALCPPPSQIIGQSLGGSVLLEYLEQHAEVRFDQVILLAPLVRPWGWRLLRIYFYAVRGLIKTRKRTITDNADNAEFIAFQHVDPLQAHVLPVAWVSAMVRWKNRFERYPARPDLTPNVVLGHADRTIDWQHTLRVLRRRYSPEILEIDEARHHLVNESEDIRARMWGWLDERCGW